MTGTDGIAAVDGVLAHETVGAAFRAAVEAYGPRTAVREHGVEGGLTFRAWADAADDVARGLHAAGVRRGDRVALLLGNVTAFVIADMGSVLLGAVPFSLYNTAPVEQLLENVDNAEPQVLFAAPEHAEKARELVRRRPGIRTLVLTGAAAGSAVPGETTLEALCATDHAFDVDGATADVRGADLVTLVYTSGTTGPPKGVQYRHDGVMFVMRAFRERLGLTPEGRVVAYLPMAHIAERLLGYYMGMAYGATMTLLPDLRQLVPALQETRPTRFFGVPRMYEKIDDAMRSAVAAEVGPDGAQALEQLLSERAEAIAAEGPLQHHERVPEPARRAYEVARRASGLDAAEWLIMSGAPCPPALLLRFHALGLRVNEFYGGSENISATSNPPDAMRLGTAGKALPGVELRLADDGEVLLRGPNVTPGYLKDPERTREAIDEDGWLHTGDVGTLDEDGYLRIVDRKKDIIINSAGKNMSPTNIEAAIKLGAPLVAQVVCVGDARPYNVALLVLDHDVLREVAARHGIDGASTGELARHPVVRDELDAIVARGNARLSRVEQIKRYSVLDRPWTPGGDELTATGKLRRRNVTRLYAEEIDALYVRDAAATGAPR
ncbi:AMP-dependent synthetase/ligase [Patulibacter sp. S7RM1-6]